MRIYRLKSTGSTFFVLAKTTEDFCSYLQHEKFNDKVTEITLISDEHHTVDLRDLETKTSPLKPRRLFQEIEDEKERMRQAGNK